MTNVDGFSLRLLIPVDIPDCISSHMFGNLIYG
jgi:hypothetical protein